MKTIIAAAIALLVAGTSAHAQKKDQGQKHKMEQELGLTAEQKAEMKKIHEAEKNELEVLKKDTQLSKEEFMTARKAVHEKYRDQFKNVLTEEQQKKAREMRNHHGDDHEMKKDSGNHHKGAAPKNGKAVHRDGAMKSDDAKPSKDRMEAELGLTEGQKSKIKASREDFKTKAEAIKSNEKLTREQKQEQMKKLAEKQKEEMRSILTAEQREKLEANRKGQPKRDK